MLTTPVFSALTISCLLVGKNNLSSVVVPMEDECVPLSTFQLRCAGSALDPRGSDRVFMFSFDSSSDLYLMLTVFIFRGCDEVMAGGRTDTTTNVEMGQLYLA